MFSYCSTTENRAYYIRQITCFLVLQDFFGEQQGGLASWKLVCWCLLRTQSGVSLGTQTRASTRRRRKTNGSIDKRTELFSPFPLLLVRRGPIPRGLLAAGRMTPRLAFERRRIGHILHLAMAPPFGPEGSRDAPLKHVHASIAERDKNTWKQGHVSTNKVRRRKISILAIVTKAAS